MGTSRTSPALSHTNSQKATIFFDLLSRNNGIKAALKREYEMKDPGELKYFFCIQVHRSKYQRLTHINQSGYTRIFLDDTAGTADQDTTYDGKKGTKLEVWIDANWGAEERESVSGFIFTVAGGSVLRSSETQSSVALSSTESEYMAILHALKELI